ncbi:MAG: ATP-binding cassette domain-containing protein [Krumholzibacteria bacterium]|nr:ATP-binding cassette domain-containing protein [Candidatus Krumholzibacteria bacterium]
MDLPAPALVANAITKRFATSLAVDGVDLQIAPGEILALLGPNGAGKTTTVRMLVGILRPDSGRILWRVDGRDRERPRPEDLGYLPEDRGLLRDAPVLRTLEYFGVLHGLARNQARARASAELERFGLGERLGERVDRLSKGNQQKVQFLAAVLHRPRVAVLDEPFSGFDPLNQQRFVDEIRRLRDEGGTVLLSAHQMDLVEQLADRLVLLDRGRVVLAGSLAEIRARTGSGQRLELELAGEVPLAALRALAGVERVDLAGPRRVALGLVPGLAVGAVLHELTARFEVRSVHSAAERLHEIFLRTVGRDLAPGELPVADSGQEQS